MAAPDPKNPLIVQSDHTILVEVDNPLYGQARDRLVRFAELVKSPEHIHTYRLTPLSIWNARAAGMNAGAITDSLTALAKYPVPEHVLVSVRDFAGRFGRVTVTRDPRGLILSANDLPLAEEIARQKSVAPLLRERLERRRFLVDPADRGRLKQALVRIGYPAEDLAGYTSGEDFPFELRRNARWPAVCIASLPGRGGQELSRRRHRAGWFRCHRVALRRRQDDRGPGVHGAGQILHADPGH